MKESEVRKAVKQYLQLKGWFCFYLLQGLGSYPGLSDLVAVKDGTVLFIELKKPGGKLSQFQRRFKQDIQDKGGHYIVVRGIEDLEGIA